MSANRTLIWLLTAFALVSAACGSAPETLASTEASSANAQTESVEQAEQVSGEAIVVEAQAATDATTTTEGESVDDTTTSTAESTTTTTEALPACEALKETIRWVDVAIDDPDGGLNMREGAGVDYPIVKVLPRGDTVGITGVCEVVGSTDWWQVQTNGQLGWVSSTFLTEDAVYVTSIGAGTSDTENAGLTGDTLDEIAAELAERYGFDDDVVINETVEAEAIDAIGGNVTYEFLGLKDDSVAGYQVFINWWVDRSADGNEVFGVIAKSITKSPICIRGVSDSGLCI